MRKLLSQVMALHVGETITPELAAVMVRQLFPDLSYKPEQFGTAECEGYVFQCERLIGVMPELHPLHELQYTETEDYLCGIPLDVDYDGMLDSERSGDMIQFTVRKIDSGLLVGNMRIYLSRSRHNKQLFGREDTFYMLPEHRGGMAMVRFWQFVEDGVRKAVASRGSVMRGTTFDSKLSNKADRMAWYLKYKPVSTRFIKIFD